MEPPDPDMRLLAMMGVVAEEILDVAEGFETFYRRKWQMVFRATAVTVGHVDLAREATDEAMTRAYERWGSIQAMENPAGWVYRVAVNWARSRQRRQRLALSKSAEGSAISYDRFPDPDLFDAIQRLPVLQKEIVVARYLLDMSEEATAAAFGVPKGTVKSRLSRALEALREEML
jgi:RNA polymerase sigma-70 factor (ECF subfamily)